MGKVVVSKKERLAHLEGVIEKDIAAFIRVGIALKEIIESELYKQSHDTFEAYCAERWDLKRRTAYQYIESSTVFENVRNCAQIEILPANEAQVRPLIVVNESMQPIVWEQAVATAPDGHITADHVRRTVLQYLGNKVNEKASTIKKSIEHATRVPQEFKSAFEQIVDLVRSARVSNWKTMDRREALRYLDSLRDLLAD